MLSHPIAECEGSIAMDIDHRARPVSYLRVLAAGVLSSVLGLVGAVVAFFFSIMISFADAGAGNVLLVAAWGATVAVGSGTLYMVIRAAPGASPGRLVIAATALAAAIPAAGYAVIQRYDFISYHASVAFFAAVGLILLVWAGIVRRLMNRIGV
jgi:hypothetical protein